MAGNFVPETEAEKLRVAHIKELNGVLTSLRSKIDVMGLDPLKLKEERDSFERQTKILRTERDALMADVQAKDSLLAAKDAELKALILTNE